MAKVKPTQLTRGKLNTDGFKVIKDTIQTDKPAVIVHSNGRPLAVILSAEDFKVILERLGELKINWEDREGNTIDFSGLL